MELMREQIRADADGPHLLITAGVHGDECEPMLAVRRLIDELPSHLRRGRVTLVPVVNESAYTLRRRAGADALDLARVCPGRDDGSISERTGAALTRLIHSADMYIDLHTGGNVYKILPLAGYNLHSDSQVLDRQRAMAKAFGLPIVWGTTARLEGRSLSVARDANVPAIYIEYYGGEFSSDGVDAMVSGCFHVAAEAGMVDATSPPEPITYFVEDDRDHSGHLQLQHPAPIGGLFVPQLNLGDVVREGDLLGEIVDPFSGKKAPVRIASDGLLLFLRVLPAVSEGDALGGILPVTQPGEVRFERA